MDLKIILIIIIILFIIIVASKLTTANAITVLLPLVVSMFVLYNQTHALKQNMKQGPSATDSREHLINGLIADTQYEQSGGTIETENIPDIPETNPIPDVEDIDKIDEVNNISNSKILDYSQMEAAEEQPLIPFTYSKENELHERYNRVNSYVPPFETAGGIDSLVELQWRKIGKRGKQTIDSRAIKGSGFFGHIYKEELDEAEGRDWRARYDDIDRTYTMSE